MIRQKQCVKAEDVKECEGVKEEEEAAAAEEEEQTEEQPTVPGRQCVAFAVLLPLQGQLSATVGPFGCAVVGHLKENRLLQ